MEVKTLLYMKDKILIWMQTYFSNESNVWGYDFVSSEYINDSLLSRNIIHKE